MKNRYYTTSGIKDNTAFRRAFEFALINAHSIHGNIAILLLNMRFIDDALRSTFPELYKLVKNNKTIKIVDVFVNLYTDRTMSRYSKEKILLAFYPTSDMIAKYSDIVFFETEIIVPFIDDDLFIWKAAWNPTLI